MAIPVKKLGDALWFSATAKGLEGIESQWDLWTGSWAIVTFVDDVPTAHLSGVMTKDAIAVGKFYAHVTSTQMKTLSVGKYTVVCQAQCVSLDYEEEFAHESLTIKAAGIV